MLYVFITYLHQNTTKAKLSLQQICSTASIDISQGKTLIFIALLLCVTDL